MDLQYLCPQCRSSVSREADAYRCHVCARRYPIVLDIPDFRLFPDPYISIEDDYRKGRALAARFPTASFVELVARYWEMTPETPQGLAEQYIRGALNHERRSQAVWARIRATRPPARCERLLDIGCGAAGFLAAAGPDFAHALGIDIAFRWLVVAKKRLEELELAHVALVCACAECLPLRDDAYDLVVAEDVLDHARDRAALLREGTRVLRRGGVFYLTTPNRFSAAPDPHVSVWGVGFLPRGLRDGYVRWRRGIPYGPIHPISYFELRRLLRASPSESHHIAFPDPSDLDRRGLSRWQRLQLRLYGLIRKVPVLSRVLNLVGPVFQVALRKDA